ncbi:hypothetical protein HPP92_016635 [Vanilla planifolia]|uniref:Uncharacterized protein n=1 Tax=Vanilla planifolia TaxID=51239 RepID=A0A835UQN3_VANPL|nr:hypothetical protein HPP92_016635 [Vanilla planifolia]
MSPREQSRKRSRNREDDKALQRKRQARGSPPSIRRRRGEDDADRQERHCCQEPCRPSHQSKNTTKVLLSKERTTIKCAEKSPNSSTDIPQIPNVRQLMIGRSGHGLDLGRTCEFGPVTE